MSTSAGDVLLGLERRGECHEGPVLEQTLFVPPDLPCLEGHFPGLPILPGLAQLAWAVGATQQLRGEELRVTAVEALKFREVLRPGQSFVARVEAPPDRDRALFEIRRDERVAASGRLRLAAEVPPLEPGSVNPLLAAVAADGDPGRDVREFLPQEGPMVFLDRVLRADEERTVCSLRVDSLPLFRSANGALPAWAGIESLAQCIAAHGGLEARRRGEAPRIGFLLGTRRLRVGAAWLQPGVDYVVMAEQVWGGEEGLVSFECSLVERKGGRRLLAGRINAYLPSDLGELIEGTFGE